MSAHPWLSVLATLDDASSASVEEPSPWPRRRTRIVGALAVALMLVQGIFVLVAATGPAPRTPSQPGPATDLDAVPNRDVPFVSESREEDQ